MKCTIPEISWHNRDPVLSLDIQVRHAETEPQRLATGGTDSHVLIWHITTSEGSSTTVEVVADLTRHEKAVNAVRWSPSGELLASGDDESVIIIWKQRTDADPPALLDQTSDQDKETWLSIKVLRGHLKDVYDISWSPDSKFLISGSIDNTAMLWNVSKGRSYAILDDHKNFVQGVAWDPTDKYLATLSSDRTCRVFDVKSKKIVSRSSKSLSKGCRLYHDDTLQSFFRRLCFSPDGVLLIAPSGCMDKQGNETINTTYIYTKYSFKQPVATLPTKEYSVAARCCPLLFCLRYDSPVIPLPYRMVIAIATRSSVILYDTEQPIPFAVISNIHYTRLTDLAWSSDGRILAVSSTDGFCSIITFSENELGEVYKDVKSNNLIVNTSDVQSSEMDTSEIQEKDLIETKNEINNTLSSVQTCPEQKENEAPSSPKEISLDTDHTLQPIQIENKEKSESVNSILSDKESEKKDVAEDKSKENMQDKLENTKKTPNAPRRVQLITLSSPGIKKKLL